MRARERFGGARSDRCVLWPGPGDRLSAVRRNRLMGSRGCLERGWPVEGGSGGAKGSRPGLVNRAANLSMGWCDQQSLTAVLLAGNRGVLLLINEDWGG